jgi:hypothetical protein
MIPRSAVAFWHWTPSELLLGPHYVFAIAGSPGRLSGPEITFLASYPDRFVVSAVRFGRCGGNGMRCMARAIEKTT